MVKFQAFYTILLVTVLVAVVSVDCQGNWPPVAVCDLDPDTEKYKPNNVCRKVCADEGMRAMCNAYRCYCSDALKYLATNRLQGKPI